MVEPPPQRIANPTAVFSGLDKITGRITSFDVAINETVQFGALQVTPRVCYSRPPTETPQTDSFVEVDEVTLQGEIKRIFTGWMFAASPGLHAVEHPIYDVWLTDCKGGKNPAVAEAPDDEQQPAAKPAAQAAAAGAEAAPRSAHAEQRLPAAVAAQQHAVGEVALAGRMPLSRTLCSIIASASAPLTGRSSGSAAKSASPDERLFQQPVIAALGTSTAPKVRRWSVTNCVSSSR